ncbi:MAG: DUF2933 domain-containing protein [Bacillaceae bacterium]|nr:DUF2933 domain-containing protein [Bacillaceae bacterium]
MENILYYLPLLACPLMLGLMFFMMRGSMGGDHKSKKSDDTQQQMQNKMNELMEQNNRLMREMEEVKKSQ